MIKVAKKRQERRVFRNGEITRKPDRISGLSVMHVYQNPN
jgi:hypothetical protein